MRPLDHQTSADSSSKCNHRWLLGVTYFNPEEYLVGSFIAKNFSWSMVKFLDRLQYLRLSDVSQFHAFGEVLPKQSVAVLI